MSPSPDAERPLPPSAPPASMTVARRFSAALLLAIVFLGGMTTQRLFFDGEDAGASSSLVDLPAFQTLLETWDAIQTYYVDTDALDAETLIYGASRGMVDALGDTGHSTFLDPAEAEAFDDAANGEFVGIGVQIDYSTGRPVIISAIDGSPAAAAGIRARDVIVEIDGESTDGLTQTRAAQRLRGRAGTDLTLTLERPSTGERYTLTLTRERIKVEPVSWALLPDNVGLIRLSEFSTGATDGVKAALRDLKRDGATSIILDLRDNPGGLVFEAIGVASQFMEEGTPIYQYQERDQEPRPVRATGVGLGLDLPMAVLVNEGSASAAEIVASGLRDNGRATLYGATTFGTGTVLTAFALSDGSAVVLGIGLWLTADGDQIWHKGVEPDVAVDLAPADDPLRPAAGDRIAAGELERSGDRQLLEAFDDVVSE